MDAVLMKKSLILLLIENSNVFTVLKNNVTLMDKLKNMCKQYKDYKFCVSAAPHTILLEHANTAEWGTDSYVEIQIGGVAIAQGFVDRLGIDRFEVYRMVVIIVFYL